MDANQDQGAKELFQGQAQLYKLMFNHLSSMSLKLMRLLVHSGCFKKTKVNGEEEAYGLTAASTLLIKDKPYCLSPTVSVFVDPFFVAPFQSLSSWFKGTEITLWETVHGIKFWEFMNQNPAINQRFNEAMASDSEIMTTFVVKSECKQIFEGLGSLVDVGGGNGTFSRIISEAFPGIKCTVLDLPHAVANLPEADNLKYIAGDMFRFIPPADAFLFKLVFHGLGDEDGLKILKKRREAIASNGERGKVIIIDIVINAEEEEHELTETKFLFDIMMSVNATGKERTESEWAKLFFDAGFSHYKIHY
ncbi:hypothetical protein WN943_029767 [Citrus x changshan-huyou]